MELNKIHNIDCLAGLKLLPDKSVHCVVTSPPYWGLRDYGMAGQVGLEKTPKLFIKSMVAIFKEVKRVLRDDGTLWLNIGDSYAANGKNRSTKQATAKSTLNGTTKTQEQSLRQQSLIVDDLKPKDLVGIPWMMAFALRADGYYLRQDIIWAKPNPMPESVTDRCTKSHEYFFLLSKSKQYYYDHIAIMQEAQEWTGKAAEFGRTGAVSEHILPGQSAAQHRPRKSGNKERKNGSERGCPEGNVSNVCSSVPWEGLKANKRSIWTIATKPYAEAHFATFPEDLITDPIKAGTSEYGCCENCGNPYKRLYRQQLVPTYKASFNSKPDERDAQADAQDAGSNRMKDGHKPGWINKTNTLGWVPSCKCPNTKRIPCTVLDPFMGAGTTALVAQKLGRNFIGFELNPKYVAMANKRLNSHLGMFSPDNIKAIEQHEQLKQLTIE